MTTPPTSDPRNRRSRVAVLAAAVLVVVLGVGAVAVVERRDRRELEDRVARLESEAAATRPDETGADADADADVDANPLAALLDSLTGGGAGGDGGGALGGLAGGDLFGECGEAFAGALGDSGLGGLGGLFGGGAADEGGDDPDRQVAKIIGAVEELRGLRFTTRPSPVFVSPEQMRERVRQNVEVELPADAAAAETRMFIALGALPAGSDLKALTLQALGDQVAGFYDTRSDELVVSEPDGGGGLSAQARIVLAHELDHALADQVLGLPVEDGRPAAGTEDSSLARLTLVEGDATLLMQLYGLGHVPITEQLGGIGVALDAQADLARLPQ
ncbi:MAG: hypothetical protein ABIW46_00370, partial [Acidimicrobiales bacterium]